MKRAAADGQRAACGSPAAIGLIECRCSLVVCKSLCSVRLGFSFACQPLFLGNRPFPRRALLTSPGRLRPTQEQSPRILHVYSKVIHKAVITRLMCDLCRRADLTDFSGPIRTSKPRPFGPMPRMAALQPEHSCAVKAARRSFFRLPKKRDRLFLVASQKCFVQLQIRTQTANSSWFRKKFRRCEKSGPPCKRQKPL